ncbi:MAG: Spi family protease inhibitor [Muribaculaceae bacterium]|nr:Spi family protease inhibitor [Muribaculaceae bacterium]
MAAQKFIAGLAAIVAVGLYGCSSMEDPLESSKTQATLAMSFTDDNKRSAEEAVALAQAFFAKTQSRSSQYEWTPECLTTGDYSKMSRGEDSSYDTLAYIVNRGDGDGFMVISSDKRLPDVLAFSEVGKFEISQDPDNIVNALFVNNLDKYKQYKIPKSVDGYDFSTADGLFDKMIQLCPQKAWQWDQGDSIYAHRVWIEHPECPVGCVGLATGLVITYCSTGPITINNRKYHPHKFREGMIYGKDERPGSQYPGPIFPNVNPYGIPVEEEEPDFSDYEAMYKPIAMYRIAEFLSDIGKDLGLRYTKDATYGDHYKAKSYLQNKGFETSALKPFDLNEMITCLENEDILYAYAYTYKFDDFAGAHVWVIDGCCFDYSSDDSGDKENIFLHCNWGENVHMIGFYRGDVLRINFNGYYNYRSPSYFSVKKKQ